MTTSFYGSEYGAELSVPLHHVCAKAVSNIIKKKKVENVIGKERHLNCNSLKHYIHNHTV